MVKAASAAIFLVLVAAPAWPQSSSASPKTSTNPPPAVTPEQREAQKHFRVADNAIKDGNLDVALDELKKAVALDGKNSYIWYDLAIVQSKKGLNQDALNSLNKAEELGLPVSLKGPAGKMRGTLTYNVEKQKKTADNLALSADDTLKYLSEKLSTYGFAVCAEPQTLGFSSDRRKIIYRKSFKEDNSCTTATYEIPVFQLQYGWFSPAPIADWDDDRAIYKENGEFHKRYPDTGDYSYNGGATGILFACKAMAKCIVGKNGGTDHSAMEVDFSAPDEQIMYFRRAVVHLVESLVNESQQQSQRDPFAK
jgi:hypothetical protein